MTKSIRLRAHIEPLETATTPSGVEPPLGDTGLAARRAFFVHSLVDDRDSTIATLFRETFDGRTIEEGVAAHEHELCSDVRAWAAEQRPDLGAGMVGEFKVLSPYKLSRKVISRCYRYGVPLVGWDLPWQLGRLAGHVGKARGGEFSVTLIGCGREVDGRWKDSDYCPRVRITPQGSGQVGAFFRWLPPRDEASRSKTRGQRFIELGALSGTVLGGELSGLAQAAELMGLTRPEDHRGS